MAVILATIYLYLKQYTATSNLQNITLQNTQFVMCSAFVLLNHIVLWFILQNDVMCCCTLLAQRDNAYIFVSRHIRIITYYYMVVNLFHIALKNNLFLHLIL